MKTENERARYKLKTGQLWKLEDGYVSIVESGHALIHFKILRNPDQKAAITRVIRLDALINYLNQNDAKLINTAGDR